MNLQIVIPALNEQDSIARIVQRCLDCRSAITRVHIVDEIEITVVSDGSTDATAEIARTFEPEIKVIEFSENQGYGAAIKKGWSESSAELLAFLDADGTCDPAYLEDLCREMERTDADIVLGSRLHDNSEMPAVRRIGNTVFSVLLSFFSSTKVRDTASGMRVVKKSALPRLLPLPDGLDFTPAMSARALMRSDVTIVEIDMPYSERAGKSKLNVIVDGFRFLGVIMDAILVYRPSRLFLVLSVLSTVAAIVLMYGPVVYYVRNHFVEEWMIYRFIVSHFLATAALIGFSIAFFNSQAWGLSRVGYNKNRVMSVAEKFIRSSWFWLIPVSCVVAATALVLPAAIELGRTSHVYEPWSRFVLASFLGLTAVVLVLTRVIYHSMQHLWRFLILNPASIRPTDSPSDDDAII